MTTPEFITALFYHVDEQLRTVPKHPEARLWPSEVITLGLPSRPLPWWYDVSLRSGETLLLPAEGTCMKMLHKLFPLGHCCISLLFIGCGLALIAFAGLHLWHGIQPWDGLALNQRLHTVLDSIAVLTVAVAALELGQTILEEEVQREAQMSAPTRVRRFLSRFMIVLVVSLSIEALVAVFQFTHAHPERLPYAAAIGLMAAALLAAWGLFIWLNRSAEELEPQAMEQAQREDKHVP